MRLIDADALERMGYVLTRTYQKDKETMVCETKILSDVPSVEQDRKGRWIHERVYSEYSVTGYFILRRCECSECGAICEQEFNFCPNCGTDMRGEE